MSDKGSNSSRKIFNILMGIFAVMLLGIIMIPRLYYLLPTIGTALTLIIAHEVSRNYAITFAVVIALLAIAVRMKKRLWWAVCFCSEVGTLIWVAFMLGSWESESLNAFITGCAGLAYVLVTVFSFYFYGMSKEE